MHFELQEDRDDLLLHPKLIEALEILRAWCAYFRKSFVRVEWARRKKGGPHHAMLHEDSGADWGTTLDMVTRAFQIQADLLTFATAMADAPPLPDATQWKLLEVDKKVLEALHRPMLLLQKEEALAAQVVPAFRLTHAELMDLTLADGDVTIPTLALEEFGRMLTEHMKSPLPSYREPMPASTHKLNAILAKVGVTTWWELLELAAMCVDPPEAVAKDAQEEEQNPDCEPSDTTARVLRKRWETFMTLAADVPRDSVIPQPRRNPATETPARESKERVGGMNAYLDKLDRKGQSSSSTTVADCYLNQHEQRVVAQARSFMVSGSAPGAASSMRILNFWKKEGQRHYAELIPGVRLLLSLVAGNGQLERLFGKAKAILSSHRLTNALGTLFLWANAAKLGLEGYARRALANPGQGGADDEYVLFYECADDKEN